jgi:RNA recognition motif-containing protein
MTTTEGNAAASSKLYVGNLSYNTTDGDLEQMFEEFGTVLSALVIMDRETGRSKGFGFVEMRTVEESTAAITGLNGTKVDNRTLTVAAARPKTEQSSAPRANKGYSKDYSKGYSSEGYSKDYSRKKKWD